MDCCADGDDYGDCACDEVGRVRMKVLAEEFNVRIWRKASYWA